MMAADFDVKSADHQYMLPSGENNSSDGSSDGPGRRAWTAPGNIPAFPTDRGSYSNHMMPWRIVPAVIASILALVLAYEIYESLNVTQTFYIASGAPGGGYYELGDKLRQVLNADLGRQRFEAPLVFQSSDSGGPRENLNLLAERRAQLGLALEGLSVKPKEAGDADIRGLMKLSTSNLHIVVAKRLDRQLGKTVTKFTDLLDMAPSKLGRPLRIYLGSPHGSTHSVMNLILNYYKVSTDKGLRWDVIEQGTYADAAHGLLDGTLDVVCLLVAVGSPAIVAMSHDGSLIPVVGTLVDAIHTLNPALLAGTIPSGVYNKDFPQTEITTLAAEDILVANAQISNRLAYRIVRTVALHWPELQAGMLLPEDFAKAQLSQNDYFPLHPGAVAYYKGESVPLWPWFEDKVRLAIDHRDIVLSIVGGIPTVYTLFYAWSQRRRVAQLMSQVDAMRRQGAIDRATIENIRMRAITLVAQGKLSRESYATLNEFIEAQARSAKPGSTPDESSRAA